MARFAGPLQKLPTSRLVRDAATLLRLSPGGLPFSEELTRRAELLENEAKEAAERCIEDIHRVGCPCDLLKRIGERR